MPPTATSPLVTSLYATAGETRLPMHMPNAAHGYIHIVRKFIAEHFALLRCCSEQEPGSASWALLLVRRPVDGYGDLQGGSASGPVASLTLVVIWHARPEYWLTGRRLLVRPVQAFCWGREHVRVRDVSG